MTTVAVLQSNYLPWKGYFDIANDVDLFVFYDDVQYTKNDWRNRNRIKTPQGMQWLTIPVGPSDKRLICEVTLPQSRWQAEHWKTLTQHYRKCPYFLRYRGLFDDLYLGQGWTSLSELNQTLIRTIAVDILGVRTGFASSQDYLPAGRKLDRLLDLLTRAGAGTYVSGPAGKGYIDPQRLAQAAIELRWKDYAGYPAYPQRYPPFEHGVSVLDLIFNTGPDAPWYIWGWRQGPGPG